MEGTGMSVGSAGPPEPEKPEAVLKTEQFFSTPFNVDFQESETSERLHVEFLHSWPMKKTMNKEEFIKMQRAIEKGCPDWDYRAQIWNNTNFDNHEVDEHGNTVVHATLHARCRHSDMLEIEGLAFGNTEEDVIFPREWVSLYWSNTEPPLLEHLVFRQILDIDGCSTGGLCGIPGLMFAMNRPLPPPLTELLAPIPPYTAADNRDPNFKMRIQVFKQIVKRDDPKKKVLKESIELQKAELNQHIDYLRSIRNYL